MQKTGIQDKLVGFKLISSKYQNIKNSVDFGRVGVYSLEKMCIGVGGGVYMFRK